jgi:NAD(P)-dependent dehydrogenase (short-subunit alcohol dehydrogenase family)
MPTVFITGANRGIGLALTKEYLQQGWRVHATVRSANVLTRLKGLKGDLQTHLVDTTDLGAMQKLAQSLKGEAIDVLMANAGVMGPTHGILQLDIKGWMETFQINAIGSGITAHCFIHHVAGSPQKKMIAITSLMGSIEDNRAGAYIPYRTSKSALNMTWKSLSVDLKSKGIIAAVLHPGWVQTDMGGPGADIDAETSARGIIRVIDDLKASDSGKFFNYLGKTIPW